MAVEANSLSDCFFTFKCSARNSKVAFNVKQEFVTVRGASCSLLLEKQLMLRIFFIFCSSYELLDKELQAEHLQLFRKVTNFLTLLCFF